MGISKTLCFLAILLSLAPAVVISSPPRIVKQPPSDELLFQVAAHNEVDKPFIIECEAEGQPAPKYRWIKNGKPFEYNIYDDRILQQTGRGTLEIIKPHYDDLGQYQCFAENEFGTATSNSVYVRSAELNSFNSTEVKNVNVQEGEPLKLSCAPPDGYPKPKVYWMLLDAQSNIKSSINDSRITTDPEGNLLFSNVTLKDAFSNNNNLYYSCAVKSLYRNEYKFGNKVTLIVERTGGPSSSQNKREPVQQYVTRKKETAQKSKRTELYCIFGGTPLPQVIWSKNGVPIRASNEITQDNYGKTLVIKKTAHSDNGTYTCEVSNGVGSAKSYSIELQVEALPFFTREPREQNKAEGETAIIRCEAGGNPKPAIQWIHNGKPIREGGVNYPRRTISDNEIRIVDLTKSDTGNYGCNATNNVGYVYKDVFINVQLLEPEFTEKPSDIVTVDGKEAVLRCRVFGAPKPIVKWMRDDVDVTGGKYNITDEGDLVIPDVTFTDAGKYECYAKNRLAEVKASGSLTVKKHTVITNKPIPYQVKASEPATFRCNAAAYDTRQLVITWLKGNQSIDYDFHKGRFQVLSDNTLHIQQTNELDSGIYTCQAKTDIEGDVAEAQATLLVRDVPNAPELISLECKSSTADLRWKDMGDNRAIIQGYIIQYNTTFTPDTWDVAADDVPLDKHWVIQLNPWANYTFRVISRNEVGLSKPSAHSDVCTTAPDLPEKNPDNVSGKGTEPTNMVISWSPMAQIDHAGPDFKYQVSWRRNITGQQWSDPVSLDWQQSEYIVRNTPTFQPYEIKVVAQNALGQSKVVPNPMPGWSGEDTPLQAPTNFTLVEVTTGNSAVFQWNHVPPESLRGHFMGYKIQSWTDEEDSIKEFIIPANSNKQLVTIFRPFKKNYARILAYNSQYNGPPSDTLHFVTPEGTPGPVRSFEAFPIGSSAMLLKWDKPENENGILTGYKIYYQTMVETAPGEIQERKKEIDPKFDRAKLAGLQPNTKYKIMIKAKTKAGESNDTMYVIRSTKDSKHVSAPDIPVFETKVLSGKDHGSTAHLLVRWLPSFDGHAGTDFSVQYRLKGHPDWVDTRPVTDDDFVIVTGLEPAKLYEVKINAHDGGFYSSSEIKEVDTTTDGPLIMRDDKMATAGWFIGVMLALAFLLLVLVLVCVARRNRGGKYDVHDRELAHGRRDYPDAGFHEYTHPVDNKSRHSMSSGTKPGPESDTDSMAEYGEGETGRFTEDGSFIGQYVPGARVLPPPAPAAPPPAPLSPPAPRNNNQPPTYV